jgi:hypothetical protein
MDCSEYNLNYYARHPATVKYEVDKYARLLCFTLYLAILYNFL